MLTIPRTRIAWFGFLGCLLWGLPCLGDPVEHENSDESKGWETEDSRTQLASSSGLAPPNTGTIFVPRMSRNASEPKFRIIQNGKVIASQLPGSRAFVTPGEYVVEIGSGAEDGRMKIPVVVHEGRTQIVEPQWGTLLVTILDERGTPFRGGYELVRLPDRDFVGIGLGADVAKGERLTAWYLPPGLYMLLAPGESYQARRNFITVRLAPGHFTHVTLVQNEGNGDILGGGELAEFQTGLEVEGWDLALVLGGSLAFVQTQALAEKTDGQFVNVEGFVENINRYTRDKHFVYTRFYLEESSRELKLPDSPYLKDDDKIEGTALYSYRVKPFFGPYIRAGVESHLLPSVLEFEQPTDVVRINSAGEAIKIQPNRDYLYMAPSFSNVRTRVGMGARFEGNPAPWLDIYSLFGLAARQLFTNHFFVDEDDPTTALYEIKRRDMNTLLGIEGALVAQLSITRWVLCQLEADVLAPMFSLPDRERTGEPVIGLTSTIALRLASFASLNYVFELERDPDITTRSQIENSLLLRFAYKVF